MGLGAAPEVHPAQLQVQCNGQRALEVVSGRRLGRPSKMGTQHSMGGSIQGQAITSDVGPDMRDAFHGEALQGYAVQKDGIAPEAWASINWDALDMSMMTFPSLFQLWVAKHASGFCGVGKMMKIWGFWQEDKCLCCLLGEVETVSHLLCCPAPQMQKAFKEGVQEIQEWMQ